MNHSNSIEISDNIEIFVDQLESEAEERSLTRDEQAVLDVFDNLELISSEGLHGFWHEGSQHEQVIQSFDLIGASQVVDLFNASQWVRASHGDIDQFTERESDHLSEIEENITESLEEACSMLEEFIEDNFS